MAHLESRNSVNMDNCLLVYLLLRHIEQKVFNFMTSILLFENIYPHVPSLA